MLSGEDSLLRGVKVLLKITVSGSTPSPWSGPFPRPWSETMVWIPLWAQKTLEIKGCLGLERPFWDLVSQTPRPRGRGRPLLFDKSLLSWAAMSIAWTTSNTIDSNRAPEGGICIRGILLTCCNVASQIQAPNLQKDIARKTAFECQGLANAFFISVLNLTESEYGFLYGSKRWKSQFWVDSQLKTQLRKQTASKLF